MFRLEWQAPSATSISKIGNKQSPKPCGPVDPERPHELARVWRDRIRFWRDAMHASEVRHRHRHIRMNPKYCRPRDVRPAPERGHAIKLS